MDVDLAKRLLDDEGVRNVREFGSADEAVKFARQLYDDATLSIAESLERLRKGESPTTVTQTQAYYPLFAVPVPEKAPEIDSAASSGFCHVTNRLYIHTATRVGHRAEYLRKNLSAVVEAHKTKVLVGQSTCPIPVEFVTELNGDENQEWLDRFTRFSYLKIMKNQTPPKGWYYLSPYEALLYDYYWSMLEHYTGTDPAHFQNFIVLVNYKKYEPEIVRIGRALASGEFQDLSPLGDTPYTEFVPPGEVDQHHRDAHTEWQMPAFHMRREDRKGVSFVNVGVGAPSAVTLSKAVCCCVRPDLVLMAGHCGGTGMHQRVGHIVTASNFVSYCGATKFDIPPEMQIMSLGEVQQSIKGGVQQVFELDHKLLDRKVESGPLVSLDDRHWVIDSEWYARIANAGASAVDMEGAAVARCCMSNRTPYGFVGMITDIPPYDKPKLRGEAQRLYEDTKSKFVLVPLRACELLREGMLAGRLTPHSRKLEAKFFPPGSLQYQIQIPYAFA